MPFAPKNTALAFQLLQEGAALRAQGRTEAAIAAFTRAVEADPANAEAHHQLGNAFKSIQRHAEAVISLQRASQLAPNEAVVWLNLGVSQLALSAIPEAIASFQRAVALEPNRPEAHNILGSALLDAGCTTEAAKALGQALRLRPAYPAAHDNLGRVLRAQGLAVEALAEFRAALAGSPRPETHSNYVYALNFVPGFPRAEMLGEHRCWAQAHARGAAGPAVPFANDRNPDRRLRIGYVSPDFVHHAVAYFFEPVLAARDRSKIEVVCYSNAAVADAVTTRLRALSDGWRDIAGKNDDVVCQQIRADRIDILVDLAGHTAGNRLAVFARRPAPVQVTWLGYPNTTGLDAIQWRITDAVADPLGQTDAFHSERLCRLPGPFSCYRPPEEAPAVSPPPSGKNGYVTFGSFNHFSKLNPAVLDSWARLLARVPGSHLLLKARSLADAATATRVQAIFAARGVQADRLELLHAAQSVAAHLSLYSHMDIALDPFPYNGTTTTCEALWMGVPVVTLAGSAHAGRVSASLLTHLGRPEWVAYSENEYLDKAAGLADSAVRLAEARGGQRERMRGSPLCDATRFGAGLEAAYRSFWQAWLAEEGRT